MAGLETYATVVVALLGAGYLLWKWGELCSRWGWPLLIGVLAVNGALFFLGSVAPYALLGWNLWLFYVDARWKPSRGLFPLPRWPRAPLMRGPGGKRRREFQEPMPWARGPYTF